MDKIKFYDTNALLHNDIEKIEGKIYISSISLMELEHIKVSKNKDEDLKFQARKVTRWLRSNEDKYECVIADNGVYDLVERLSLQKDNDNIICASAYSLLDKYDVEFVTNDICCYNIAKNIFELNCTGIQDKVEENYKGYKSISVTSEEYTKIYNEYSVSKNNVYNLLENEYLIINDLDNNKTIEYRYNGKELKQINLPPSKIVKGLNSKQRCALDLLNNKDIPIKIVAGNYGSGKTLLSVKSALYQLQEKGAYSKIMLVRNPIGSGESIGYLKGTQEDKTRDFYTPISQNLEGGEFQLQNMKMKGEIEAQIPYYMKGLSLNQTFILADECEDLDVKLFKLIGTRIGEGSCVAFVGDWKQAEKKFTSNNGLFKFIDFAKGNPLVGIVVLDEDVRSDASKVFCDFE